MTPLRHRHPLFMLHDRGRDRQSVKIEQLTELPLVRRASSASSMRSEFFLPGALGGSEWRRERTGGRKLDVFVHLGFGMHRCGGPT